MKKIIYSTGVIIALLAGIYGCDKVKSGDYYKPVSASNADTKVLIEDFTGQKCGNCPRAAETALQLKSLYGNQIVVVALHVSDQFAKPDKKGDFTYDFRTPEGTFVDSVYGISAAGLPQGMVNRKVFNGSPRIAYGAWGQSVAQLLSTAPAMVIDTLTATYDTLGLTINVKTNTKFITSLSGKYNMVVCITEDSIIKPQEDYSKSPQIVPNYVHHHALRATLTAPFGDPFVTAPQAANRLKKEFKKALTKKPDWNPKHLYIVAFITDATTNEVLQVNESHVQ